MKIILLVLGLLFHDEKSQNSSLARFILDGIHFGYQYKVEELFLEDVDNDRVLHDPGFNSNAREINFLALDPYIHRECMLLLLEVRIIHTLFVVRSGLFSTLLRVKSPEPNWWLQIVLSLQTINTVVYYYSFLSYLGWNCYFTFATIFFT